MSNINRTLADAQSKLGVNMREMADLMSTNYNTYKAWYYGVNPLPNAAKLAVMLMLYVVSKRGRSTLDELVSNLKEQGNEE